MVHTIGAVYICFNFEDYSEIHRFILFSLAAAMIGLRLPSVEGAVFDVIEGVTREVFLSASGFSYGSIPLRVSFITYSDFMDMGFNLTDEFDLSDLPTDAAQGA